MLTEVTLTQLDKRVKLRRKSKLNLSLRRHLISSAPQLWRLMNLFKDSRVFSHITATCCHILPHNYHDNQRLWMLHQYWGFFFVWLQKYKYRITQSMDNRDNNNEFEQDPRPVVLIILPCNKGLESSYIMGHVKLLTVNCIE